MNFSDLGLSAPLLDAISSLGYDTPSAIQSQAIPAVLKGRDIMAAAQTGTGKTAGFALPILESLLSGSKVQGNQARTLVLTPTRELAIQVAESFQQYAKNTRLNIDVVYGGVKINPQMQRLRKGVDVLVATPGRLLDLHNQNAIKFNQLDTLVLDEADRMLDMGFIHDIKKIIAKLPVKRQNLLFSATFSDEIRDLAKGLIHDPIEIEVSPRNTTAETVAHKVYPVDKNKKNALLVHLMQTKNWNQVLVFTRTKHGANRLVKHLDKHHISAAAIHGNKSQGARQKALQGFKQGELRALVATDIVARGLDIDQLPQVVNFDLPNVAEDYVHRIGRTGRAGANGEAVSFVTAACHPDLALIERLIQQLIERDIEPGFEPVNPVPESVLDTRPLKKKKPKKAKKPKSGHPPGSITDQSNNQNAEQQAKPSKQQRRKPSGQRTQRDGQGEQNNKTAGERKPRNGNQNGTRSRSDNREQKHGNASTKRHRAHGKPQSKPKA